MYFETEYEVQYLVQTDHFMPCPMRMLQIQGQIIFFKMQEYVFCVKHVMDGNFKRANANPSPQLFMRWDTTPVKVEEL